MANFEPKANIMNKRILSIFTSFLSCSISFAQTPTNGLVAYYPLNNDTKDYSIFKNDGTPKDIIYAIDRFGKTDGCAKFNGTSSMVTILDAPQIRTGIFSVSVWIKPTDKSSQVIYGKTTYETALNEQYNMGFNYPGQSPGLWASYKQSGCNNPATNFTQVKVTDPLSYQNWQLVTSTFDGLNIKIYVNEKLVKTTATTFTEIANCTGANFHLGAWWKNFPDYYQGLMDDVRIYSRGISSEEVYAIYNDGITNGMVAYYPMDGNANDATVYANHGLSTNITPAVGRCGGTNTGLYFNGTTSFIEIPDAIQIRPDFITISVWFNPTNKADQHLVGKSTFSNSMNEQYSLGFNYFSENSPGLYGSIKQDLALSCSKPGENFAFLKSTNPIQVNKWQLGTLTYDGGNLKLYLNETLIKSVASTSKIANCQGGTLRLGKWWQNFPDYFQGVMDDARIYNRALSAEEVKYLYNLCPIITTVPKEGMDFEVNNIKVYPNPTNNGSFTINNPESISSKWNIYNSNGIKITELNIPFGESTYDFNNQPKGIYFIKSSINENSIKIIIQ